MKNFWVIFFIVFGTKVVAQSDPEQKFLLTQVSNATELSEIQLTDPYLSPITYSGLGIGFHSESSRFFSPDNTHYSYLNEWKITGGVLLNPTFSSSMLYAAGNYQWGARYHFRFQHGFQLLAGSSCDLDLGIKDVSRNVNNPVNIDLASSINFIALGRYDLTMKRKTIRIELSVKSPLLGCMYVPLSGASYYEMFSLGNLSNAVHFSSLYNKRGIDARLTVDVPFKRVIWKFGLQYSELKYKANDMVFNRNSWGIVVGTSFDAIHFGGRKMKAPENFMSTRK